MKKIAFRRPSVTQVVDDPCGQILLPYYQTHFKSFGRCKNIVFMSRSSQDSGSCINKNVVETAMGDTLCIDSILLL